MPCTSGTVEVSTEMLYPVMPSDANAESKRQHPGPGGRVCSGHAEYRAGLFRRAVGQAAKAKIHRTGRLSPGSGRQAADGTFHCLARCVRGTVAGPHGCRHPLNDNAGAFLGPLLAVFLLYSLHVGIRAIFYLAIIPGLLAFFMVLLVKEQHAVVAAKSKIDVSLRQFPKGYWKYLLLTALFGFENSTNSFLILRTQDIGASLETTILIYSAFNLVAALISYPAGSLSDKWGRRNILLASFIIFLIAYLGFALTQNIVLIAALFAFYGLYQGIFRAVGCRNIYAPAAWDGTAPPSACCNW